MFGFGKKKKVCDCSTPCDPCKCDPAISIMTNGLPKVPVITKAFGFHTTLKYKDGAGTSTWVWSSDLYYDYRKALQASYDIVKKIYDDMGANADNKLMFTIDSCLLKENFLNATSSNVYEIVFADGKHIAQNTVLVDEGSNAILPKVEKLYNKA